MIALGNDVVDLNYSRTSPKYLEKLKRLSLSPKEYASIDHSGELMPWILWSLKESAYKSFVKLGYRSRFNPKSIEVVSLSFKDRKWVASMVQNDTCIYSVTEVTPHTIYTVTSTENSSSIDSAVRELNGNESPANYVRKLAILAFSLKAVMKESDLTILKSEDQIPYFYANTDLPDADLTLSHHGKYVAYAFSL